MATPELHAAGNSDATPAAAGPAPEMPHLSKAAIKRHIEEIDPNEVLIWDDVEKALAQFQALVAHAPLHSLVIHYEPDVAVALLKLTNETNRRQNRWQISKIANQIGAEDYEVTGDTIKFADTGKLLDGQHRFKACEKQGSAIISHTVFGLKEDIFDLLDQGKKRTPGDILGLAEVEYPSLVAGAINWVVQLREGDRNRTLTPRQIKRMALGPMKDIVRWAKLGQKMSATFRGTPIKQPPTLLAGLLYMIARGASVSEAEEFAEAWMSGPRTGRNKNFSMLYERMIKVKNQSGGHINREVNAAMIIIAYNHWHANEVATSRALTYRKEWEFPKLAFNAEDFKKVRKAEIRSETSFEAERNRVLEALIGNVDHKGHVEVELDELAQEANVGVRALKEQLRTLVTSKMIEVVREPDNKHSAIYKVTLGE